MDLNRVLDFQKRKKEEAKKYLKSPKKLKIDEEKKEEGFKESLFENIPNEVLEAIVSLLQNDRMGLRLVSKRWKDAVENCAIFWKGVYFRRWSNELQEDAEIDFLKDTNDWWHAYSKKSKLEFNWVKGNCKKYIIESTFGTVCNLRLDSNNKRLFSSSEDYAVRQWSLETGKCTYQYTGHQQAVWGLSVKDNVMATGGGDRAVKLWDLTKRKCVKTFQEHRGEVWTVDVDPTNNMLVSGSVDSTVVLYDTQIGMKKNVFTWHTSSVFAVQLYENLVASGSKDGTIRLFDLRAEYPVALFRNRSPVFCLQFDENILMSGHGDGSLQVTELCFAKNSSTVSCHTDSIWSLNYNTKYIVTGSVDKSVSVLEWVGSDIKPLYSIVNPAPVFTVRVDEKKLMFGDGGGFIQILDFGDSLQSQTWETKSTKSNFLINPLTSVPIPYSKAPTYDSEGKLEYTIF